MHSMASLLCALALPSLAAAQTNAPPTPPSAPSAPSPPPIEAPSVSIPAAPAPGEAPAKTGTPPAPAGAPTAATPINADYVLFGKNQKKTDEALTGFGVPPSLPPELKRNVTPGAGVLVDDSRNRQLTIEEITNTPIVSASNRLEGSLSAPATVLVLTAKDIRDRGYTEFSQILDDLPGMDVVRPYGDIYVKSYWRGYRPGGGADPYLVMVDGVVFNQLFYSDTQIMAAFPLTNIDRVEVLYGPASVVYGANAAMGVINVITRDAKQRQNGNELGTWLESRQTIGGTKRNLGAWADMTKQIDATLFHVSKDFRLRVSARIENGALDRDVGDRFEFTKDKYYADERIWTSALKNTYPNLAGKFRSPDRKQAVDARLYVGNAEFGAQLFQLSTGLGTRYPGDRQQTSPDWTTREISIFGRHTATLLHDTTLVSMLQYRQSSIVSPSLSLANTPFYTHVAPLDGPELAAVEVPGSGIVAQEDLSITAGRSLFMDGDVLSLGAGVKYEHYDLARDYDTVSATVYPLGATAPIDAAQDTTPPGDQMKDGRLATRADHIGTYALAKYVFPTSNALHAGIRYDYVTPGSQSNVAFRGGYVGTFDPVTVKLLYGQAVYVPSMYDRAGAEVGTKLKIERSQTLEANASVVLGQFALMADSYYVTYQNPIVNGVNLDARHVIGADVGARFVAQPISLWAYYSRYITAEESVAIDSESTTNIGDLAFDKVWFGATFDRRPFTATVLGRWIGTRETVPSNPIPSVPAYFTLDANIMVSQLFYDGLWLSMRAANLLDTRYFHPGTGAASSGNTPGFFDPVGNYIGSAGGINSLHAQPGRTFLWTLGLDLLGVSSCQWATLLHEGPSNQGAMSESGCFCITSPSSPSSPPSASPRQIAPKPPLDRMSR